MRELIREFFSANFMPHGSCYMWEPGLVWLQVLTNGAIGLAYVAIAFTLVHMVRRGQYLPFKGMAVFFGLFIITCGVTHFFHIYVIWRPVYWVDGSIRAVTAIASVATAIMLPPLVPKAIALSRGARAAREKGIALEALVQDLGRMYEKTKELEELKTQFFANVSHELRTPLTLVLGPAERLLSSGTLEEGERRDAETIVRNGHALLKQVNDLLDVSRLEAGKVTAEYRRADLAHEVRLVTGLFEALAQERSVAYRVEVPERLPAEIDPDKVRRVVLNLLSNAFKFTPPGQPVRCTVRGEAEEAEAVLEVADGGPGVPPEQREAVFERFRQLDGGATRTAGGTGLGLAIVKDFVELHGGRIELSDAPEGGALFRVTLPLKAPEGTNVAAPETAVEAAFAEAGRQALEELRTRTRAAAPEEVSERALVLVVEDNPDMNRYVCDTLSSRYRCASAFDGAEGLEKAVALKPDLVVSDVMMPRMSGDELVAAVRERPELSAVPVVMLTAKADEEMQLRLLHEGAQDYVMKPFSSEELLARVDNLVTMKRARDVLQRALETQMEDVERLARQVAHKKEELQGALEAMRAAREQAERASQAKTDFLGLVSHELRTPLTSLILVLHRFRLDGASLGEAGRHLLARMERSAGRLGALIDSLLEYARLQSGRLEVRRQVVDLAALLRDAADEVSAEAERKGLALSVSVDEGMSEVSTDPGILRLAVVNLLANAVKYTDAGAVTVSANVAGGDFMVSVRDTGPGLSPEDQIRIFEPFRQIEPMAGKGRAGVGLGLALVQEMTAVLGGSVDVQSAPGQGSTFTLSLPAMDAEKEDDGSSPLR